MKSNEMKMGKGSVLKCTFYYRNKVALTLFIGPDPDL
jgi:hypothetical protein